jgi:hypothetical protein
MISHAADLDGFHFVLPGDAAQKRPESVSERRGDEGPTLFGAENTMMVGTDVGHAVIQPSLRDLRNPEFNPGVETPWLFSNAPSGQYKPKIVDQK